MTVMTEPMTVMTEMTDKRTEMPDARSIRRPMTVAAPGSVRTIVLATMVVALALILGLWAVNSGGAETDIQHAVDQHRVERTTFDITVVANGELEAKNQTEIRSALESRSNIVELIDEGIRVKKGELLVRLNSETIENEIDEETLRVETSRSELVAAEAAYDIQLSDNESDLSKARLKLELSQIELQKWTLGDHPKRIQELNLAIDNGARRMEQAQKKSEYSNRLNPLGFVSDDEMREDKIRYIESQAAYESAQTNLEVYQTYERIKQEKTLNSDVEQAAAELLRVDRSNTSRLANKEADRTNKRRQLALREEKLAKLNQQFLACTINAPTNGLVVYGTSIGNGRGRMMFGGDGPLQVGQEIFPNQLLIVLPDTSEMVAAVRVHESYAGRIQPGMAAVIRCDAAQGLTFNGTVASIGVLAESGGWRDPNLREYTVKINLDQVEDDSRLKPSMRSEARIVLGEVEDAVAIPIQAVFREGRSSFVYVPKGPKFARTEVQVGKQSSTFAQIVSGLAVGDTVLLRDPTAGEIFRDKNVAHDAPANAAAGMTGMTGMTSTPGMTGKARPGPGAAPEPRTQTVSETPGDGKPDAKRQGIRGEPHAVKE
jgi:multidrug efflux pump subunit AcrA (membrane-fusion protein)